MSGHKNGVRSCPCVSPLANGHQTYVDNVRFGVRLGHLLSMMSDLVSVRVPTCPLERAKLAMSDTIFRDRYVREVHTVAMLAARAGITFVDQIE